MLTQRQVTKSVWGFARTLQTAQCFTDQLAVQRWLAVKDLRQVTLGVYQNGALQLVMNVLIMSIGLTIFAFYAAKGQDPVAHTLDNKADKVFPYFVLHELPHGIPGLLIAGELWFYLQR